MEGLFSLAEGQREGKGSPSAMNEGSKSTLSKGEVLRGYGVFRDVFSNGELVGGRLVKAFVRRVSKTRGENVHLKVGFAVSRKVRSSVNRNRIRRLLRQSYRISKHSLTQHLKSRGIFLQMILLYAGSDQVDVKRLRYTELETEVKQILRSITRRITG